MNLEKSPEDQATFGQRLDTEDSEKLQLGATKTAPGQSESPDKVQHIETQEIETSLEQKFPAEPNMTDKRRFSWDFLKFRKGSKGKSDLLGKKRDSLASIASTDSKGSDKTPSGYNDRRRSSTRMEGTSDVAAWCFV